MKMEFFPKNFNAGHWRTLQAICPSSQICNWSTWCLEILPNCCLEVFEFVILPCTGVGWREDVLRFNRREPVNNFVGKD